MAFDIDPKVIKRLSEGDQGAFRVVFEHYYPRVYEFIRRTGRITPLVEDTVNRSENFSIEDDYYAREKELIIRLTVCQMPEQRRRIFEMSRYMGMDNQTIATTLNLSKKTVENHLTLALKTLRSVLACWIAIFFGGGNL